MLSGGTAIELQWSTDATTAFTSAKASLAKAALLFYPKLDAPTCVISDALDPAVGAVLQQYSGYVRRPIAYFSNSLKLVETSYSTFDHELLAILSGSETLSSFLGRVSFSF